MSAYTNQLEQVARLLGSLNSRLENMESKQAARREEAERITRAETRRVAFADGVERQVRFADFQHRADTALEPFSVRAPSPVAGESARSYAIRVLTLCQEKIPPSNPLSSVDLMRCDDATINVFRPQIFEAVEKAAWSTESVPPGEMKERVKVDANTGAKQRHFIGERSFVCDMGVPSRRVRIRELHEFTGRAFH